MLKPNYSGTSRPDATKNGQSYGETLVHCACVNCGQPMQLGARSKMGCVKCGATCYLDSSGKATGTVKPYKYEPPAVKGAGSARPSGAEPMGKPAKGPNPYGVI